MDIGMSERLNSISLLLGDYIEVLRSYGLEETAKILAVAKLNLQCEIHRISDGELNAFCEALRTEGMVTADPSVVRFPTAAKN